MMSWLLFVCAFLFVLLVYGFIVRRYFHVELIPDEVHYTKAADGWRLAMTRYRPDRPVHGEPVILCHGLGANRYNMDFGNEHSLARFLRDRGFDVWIAELRGVGLSGRPRLFSRRSYGYGFDDFVALDVPAIIDLVIGKTGACKVFWVGHSMGGMLAYCFLQGALAGKVKGAVAVSSPPRFEVKGFYGLYKGLFRAGLLFPAIHQEQFAPYFAPLVTLLPNSIKSIVVNYSNMTPELIRRVVVNLPANISRGVLAQFADWFDRGDLMDRSMKHSYTAGMRDITTPMLLISGGADRLVPGRLVRELYEGMKSADKTYRNFSLADGARADYGHGDILVGVPAPLDVYPFIADWLSARSEKAPA
jgi:pimeloyl-ACP methyl ester carboxylesterase